MYKSTADVAGGSAYFKRFTDVSDDFVALRKEVLLRHATKHPRKIYVQPHTRLHPVTGRVVLCEFAPTYSGVIESYVARFCSSPALPSFAISWENR